MKKYILFILLMLPISLSATTMPEEEIPAIREKLMFNLAAADSATDSILIYSNLFDIAQSRDIRESDSLANIIYNISLRIGNKKQALEMLRHMTTNNLKDINLLKTLRERAKVIEDSDSTLLKETSTYIRITINAYYNNNESESVRSKRFEDGFAFWTKNPPTDIYEQIVMLNSICLTLSQNVTGDLLAKYTDELESLIAQLPPEQYSLRNYFYVHAAINYYKSGFDKKGRIADEHTLAILDSLEVYYESRQRPYRQYDRHRFVIYLRGLEHFDSLRPDEVEEFYTQAKKYQELSPRARRSREHALRLELYYAMAHKDYAKAKDYVNELIKLPLSRSTKETVYNFAIICARALNDKELLLHALEEKNKLLEENFSVAINNKVRELQVMYDVNNLRDNLTTLEQTSKASDDKKKNLIIFLVALVAVILFIAVMLIIRMYHRRTKMAHSLAEANAALSAESQRLMLTQGKLTRARDEARQANQLKSDFLSNISHELSEPLNAIVEYSRLIVDCTEGSGKAYLAEYSDMVSSNTQFLQAIFNDLFHLSEDDTDQYMIMRRELVDIKNTLRIAIETVKPGVNEGVDLFIKPDSSEVSTLVDPSRLMQVILNLLRNAVTFTETGMIMLDCGITKNNKVFISVTDTGPGVDTEIISSVFERGVVGKNCTGGKGLGLPIARMLAHLMGGELILDTSYTGGARFVLTIPYAVTE